MNAMIELWKSNPIDDLEDFCIQIGMGRMAKLYLRANLTPHQYLARLIIHEETADAIQFLTHALPKRDAVWWACLCLRLVSDPMRKAKQAAALSAVLRWVVDPCEAHRRSAGEAGKAATFGTPIGAIAMGVFFSGGSINPPGKPDNPAGPLLTANILSGTIPGIAAEGPFDEYDDNVKRFLALGIAVASGRHGWSLSNGRNLGETKW